MTDAEIRGRLLQHFYKLQYNNEGWVPVAPIILAPEPVELRVIDTVCQQLAELRLIQWQPYHADGVHAGLAKITAKGVAAVEAGGSSEIDIRFPNLRKRDVPAVPALAPDDALQRLRKEALNSAIRGKVWQQFEHGHYDTAVFEAMKAVEVAVRDAARLPAGDIGVTLVRKAFHAETGPLTDSMAEKAEREALANLFAGAIGLYKNPHSHRNVPVVDPAEAAEIVMLANHLLRIVDARRPSDTDDQL